MSTALRSLAVAIAILAVIDPAVERSVPVPVPVHIALPPASDPSFASAAAVRETIVRDLAGVVDLDAAEAPRAQIVVGPAAVGPEWRAPAFAVPVMAPPLGVRELRVPRLTLLGQQADVVAVLRRTRDHRSDTTATLFLGGQPVAAAKPVWAGADETGEVRFVVTPPAPGVHRLRVAVEGGGAHAAADAAMVVRDARLKVLVYDPRPSWPTTFVRRSLEADALFDVASWTASARRIETTAGDIPGRLDGPALDPFDAVLVGAPEALTDADAAALRRFVTIRGGALVLLPDRQLTGASRARLGLPPLDEVLLPDPIQVRIGRLTLRASELLLPRAPAGAATLATVRHAGTDRPVVISLPRGNGTVLVSGALDAWRYRGADGDLAWRSLVADAALAALRRLDVAVTPALARPGDRVTVSVSVRETEFSGTALHTIVPSVEAAATGPSGTRAMIRLWPAARPGVFEAAVPAPEPGQYEIAASIPGVRAHAVLLVEADAMHPESPSQGTWRAAELTGGGRVANTDELHARLLALEPGSRPRRVHPMRSPWWMLPFAAALSAEWVLRRRAGLR